MSTKNYPLKAGLAAIGLIWTSATAADAQEAAPPIQAPMPVPAPSNVPTFAVLLMSNGRIVQGNVALDKTGGEYLLLQKGGTIRFPKKDVERRFDSMRALYEYKVANLAPRDAGERMQLAQWCLENQMNAEAKSHLQALLTLNPKNIQVERMIASLDATAERMAESRDPEVRTTSATVVDPGPRESYVAPLARPRGEMGRVIEQPVIFDLPVAVARKRAVEFAQFVHPVLQQLCASCHNHNYQGDFQLVQPASRREWTPEVVRTNLDTTLRLVNRDDPLQSPLLGYIVTPHGPNARALVHGPNDPKCRTLTSWLSALKPAEPVTKAGYSAATNPVGGAVPQSGTEGFGADRLPGRPVANATASSPNAFNLDGVPKAKRATEVYEMNADSPNVPAGTKFEPPFLPGGAMPTLPKRAVRHTSPPVVQVNPDSNLPTLGSNIITAPGVPVAEGLPSLPPVTPVPPPDTANPPSSRAKKKQKLDSALLEQLLKGRQQQP